MSRGIRNSNSFLQTNLFVLQTLGIFYLDISLSERGESVCSRCMTKFRFVVTNVTWVHVWEERMQNKCDNENIICSSVNEVLTNYKFLCPAEWLSKKLSCTTTFFGTNDRFGWFVVVKIVVALSYAFSIILTSGSAVIFIICYIRKFAPPIVFLLIFHYQIMKVKRIYLTYCCICTAWLRSLLLERTRGCTSLSIHDECRCFFGHSILIE